MFCRDDGNLSIGSVGWFIRFHHFLVRLQKLMSTLPLIWLYRLLYSAF